MNDRIVRNVVIGVICLWLVWFFHPFLARRMMIPWDAATVGQWGDTFGALNALMSTLAFAAVFFTLRLQQRQISDAQKDQHRQKFDDTFFRLLSLLRDVRNELRYTRSTVDKARETTGPQALKSAANDAQHHLVGKKPVDRDLTRTEIASIYANNVHKRSEAGLGPYFRLIYTILKRIDTDPILAEAEKISYGNLLRGQLGSPEIALLALNGLTKESKDLSKYLNRFRMLRYLPETTTTRQAVERFYDNSAFEPRND